MLQPESTVGPAKGEVVEVFLGDTLEQAMAYAVASLGPDLAVRRARKVRKGVQGLVGRDRYEVLAAAGAPVPSDDAVGSAFDALLSKAEEAEEPVRVRRTTRPAAATPVPPAPRQPTAPDDAREQLVQLLEVTAVPDAAPEPTPAPFAETALPPSPRAPVVLDAGPAPAARKAKAAPAAPKAKAAPAAPKAKAPRPAPRPAPTGAAPAPTPPPTTAAVRKPPRRRTAAAPFAPPSGWSRAALRTLGLPDVVLDALPEQDPASDLAWAGALAEAIATIVPEPAPLSAATPLVVNGHGLAGVLGLLDAATRGFTPGTISSGDRTAPATPTELALVVRAAVVG